MVCDNKAGGGGRDPGAGCMLGEGRAAMGPQASSQVWAVG